MEPDQARLERLLHRAIHRVKAADANEAIAQMRAQQATPRGPAKSYEVVLPAIEPGDYLTESLLPRLVYFLDSTGIKLPRCPGVFLSVFRGEELFFIRAADAIEELCALSGMSPAQMVQRFGANTPT